MKKLQTDCSHPFSSTTQWE